MRCLGFMNIVKKFIVKIFDSIKRSPTRLIVLSFAAVILVGAFLLSLPIAHNNNEWMNFSDALFTSTSATCVTGLIVVDTAVYFNGFGQFIIMLLIQIGGLGVMTGTTLVFIVMGHKLSLKNKLIIQEALSDAPMSRTVSLVKKIIIYTLIIETIGALVLMCSFIPDYGAIGIWFSIFISISAFCNAGFDILGKFDGEFASLTAHAGDVFVLLPIMLLIIIGGIGFLVMANIAEKRRKRRLSTHTKLVLLVTGILIIVGWIVFAAAEWNRSLSGLNTWGKIVSSLFQSVTPRTAGFNSIDQAALSPVSYIMTILLMFIGASPASTGGGIKTTTLAILLLTTFSTLRGRHEVNLGRSSVSDLTIRKVITVIFIATATVTVATASIALIEAAKGIGLKSIIFETVSAFSTVGLSMGITRELSAWSTLILGFVMFIGRVGTLTIGASIVKSHKNQNALKYSDAKVLVG